MSSMYVFRFGFSTAGGAGSQRGEQGVPCFRACGRGDKTVPHSRRSALPSQSTPKMRPFIYPACAMSGHSLKHLTVSCWTPAMHVHSDHWICQILTHVSACSFYLHCYSTWLRRPLVAAVLWPKLAFIRRLLRSWLEGEESMNVPMSLSCGKHWLSCMCLSFPQQRAMFSFSWSSTQRPREAEENPPLQDVH